MSIEYKNKHKSSLYSYNSKTHTFSFKKKNKHRKFKVLSLIIVLLLGVGGYFLAPKFLLNHTTTLDLTSLPEYTGKPYVELNDNKPSFSEKEISTESFEQYSDLDWLGRCGAAEAVLSYEMMPTEERGDIHTIYPSGWNNEEYPFIDQGYLYNRCHLIAWMLTGQNANDKNLITGTRYMNVEGMLPFETRVARYIELTHNHVAYRITPIFEGHNLLASGVEMEAYSIEDHGDNICFHVFVYNVQPGIDIDYKTGLSKESKK